jgi:hypothetical protein
MTASRREETDALSGMLPFLEADGCKFVMTIGGYFDESQRSDGDEPISVAGYLFRPGKYKTFALKWRRFLKTAIKGRPLPFFHMTKLYAGDGDYYLSADRQESAELRAAILGRAVALINQHIMCGVAVVFDRAEVEWVAPENFGRLFGSLYTSACQLCMRASANWMHEHDVHSEVAYMFESGHKFQEEANYLLNGIATAEHLTKKYNYSSHGFGDKRKIAGLQAADVLAWVASRVKVKARMNHTMKEFQPHLETLLRDENRYHAHAMTGQKLRRFIADQFGPEAKHTRVEVKQWAKLR